MEQSITMLEKLLMRLKIFRILCTFYSSNKNDLIINSLINSSNLLALKQSKYQNNLMLLTEILYPIVYKNVFDPEELKKLLQFIQFEKENLIIDGNFSMEPVQIKEENFYITEGKKRSINSNFKIIRY